MHAIVNISGTSNFNHNSVLGGGGGAYAEGATVYLSGTSSFMYNSADHEAIVNISGASNFLYCQFLFSTEWWWSI